MKKLIKKIAYWLDTKKLERLSKNLEQHIARDKEYKH